MASLMLALCGAAALAGPNGTTPAENRGIERNPPPLPRGIEGNLTCRTRQVNLSHATGSPECAALANTTRVMRCGNCPAHCPHTCTAPQAGGSSLVCTPRRWKFSGGQTPGEPSATALVQWWQTTRGRTAELPALGEEADEPEDDEPREVDVKKHRVSRDRGRVVAQSAEQRREQGRNLQMLSLLSTVTFENCETR